MVFTTFILSIYYVHLALSFLIYLVFDKVLKDVLFKWWNEYFVP